MRADKTIADYVSHQWPSVTAYDARMRTALAGESESDFWGSDDERTFHLARLAGSARLSGDRKFVDLLLEWVVDPRFAEWPRLQMTVLGALVHAGFYRTSLHLFEQILAG